MRQFAAQPLNRLTQAPDLDTQIVFPPSRKTADNSKSIRQVKFQNDDGDMLDRIPIGVQDDEDDQKQEPSPTPRSDVDQEDSGSTEKSEPKKRSYPNENTELDPVQRPPYETEEHDAPEAHSGLPIDFATAMRLSGADNLDVRAAVHRVAEANANYSAAKVAWLPNLNLGASFNHHEGEIQSTEGPVVSASRQSLFLGAGAGISRSPLNGGAGGPPRMFVDLSLADAMFKPIAACKRIAAERARQSKVFNDTMLKTGLAYYELVRSQAQVEVAKSNLRDTVKVQRLTKAFVEGGKGTPADDARMNVLVNRSRRKIIEARRQHQIASAQLATVLQLDSTKLDPSSGLYSTSTDPVPVTLIDGQTDLNWLVRTAQSSRAEVLEATARAESAASEYNAEKMRPLLPNLYLGYSGGVFGGGEGGSLPRLDGRSDFDLGMTWQIKNLGLGDHANQQSAVNRYRQQSLDIERQKGIVAEQVKTTWYRAQEFQESQGLLWQNIVEAKSALEKNIAAIKSLNGMPLEATQSMTLLAESRSEYLNAVIDYNQWQLRLMRATGQTLGGSLSQTVDQFGAMTDGEVINSDQIINSSQPCSSCTSAVETRTQEYSPLENRPRRVAQTLNNGPMRNRQSSNRRVTEGLIRVTR